MSELSVLSAGTPPEDDDYSVPIPAASAPPPLPTADQERATRATFQTLRPLTTAILQTSGDSSSKQQLRALHSLKSALATIPAAGLESCLE